MKRLWPTVLLIATTGFAAPPAPNQARLEAWHAARFGVLIHWGPASLTGRELSWSRGGQTPVEEYDRLYRRSNPVKLAADTWAALLPPAGK